MSSHPSPTRTLALTLQSAPKLVLVDVRGQAQSGNMLFSGYTLCTCKIP